MATTHSMTATERIAAHAARTEQHQADAALLACDPVVLARFGVTEETIRAARAREAVYDAETI